MATKRIRLFKAYLGFKYQDERKIYIIENCVSVAGHVAQLYKGRLRPICAGLRPDEIKSVVAILRKSYGSVTPENYQQLLPYMAKLEVTDHGRIIIDLESDHGLALQWLRMHEAKSI